MATMPRIAHPKGTPVMAAMLRSCLTLSAILYNETGIDVWGTLAAAVTGDLAWESDEIDWMKKTAMPAVDKAVRDVDTTVTLTHVSRAHGAVTTRGLQVSVVLTPATLETGLAGGSGCPGG